MMLGRYVAGTLMILLAAMLMAPDSPEPEIAQVTRAQSVPVEVPDVQPASLTTDTATTETTVARETATQEDIAENPAIKKGVEDALAAALALDSAESSEGVAAESAEGQNDVATLVATDDAAPTDTVGVWKGLSDPNAVTEINARPEPQDTPAATSVVLMIVTGTRVNVRAGPSTDFDVVGNVTEGQEIELVSESTGNWVEIRMTDSGETGFMSRNFLTEASADG